MTFAAIRHITSGIRHPALEAGTAYNMDMEAGAQTVSGYIIMETLTLAEQNGRSGGARVKFGNKEAKLLQVSLNSEIRRISYRIIGSSYHVPVPEETAEYEHVTQ